MLRVRHAAAFVVAFAAIAACADTPTSPAGSLSPMAPRFSLDGGPRNETWMWGAKNRDIVSVRALDYNNGTTKIEVAVGQNLLGPYPVDKWLDKIEVIESPKPSKHHIVGEKLIRNAKYYVIDSKTVKAGMLVCVNVHFRGANGTTTRTANPKATEHIIVCLTVVYAADVAVTAINYPRTASFFEMPPLTATVAELMGVTATTFNCVLRINNQVRETIPMTLAAGTQGTCEFDYRFSNADDYDIKVTAETVLPGDIDFANNELSDETSLVITFPDDPPIDPDLPPQDDGGVGSTRTPFCCNYFANERYDTTFKRIRVTDISTGAVLSDSGFIEYKVSHDSFLNSFWDSDMAWPITRLAVAHQTSYSGGSLVFDDQKKYDVAAQGDGSCVAQEATEAVFGFTLCASPFPFSGPRFGTMVTNLTYSHSFSPIDPVRRDYVPNVTKIWTCADGSTNCLAGQITNPRSLIVPNPLPPSFTGGVPNYGNSMAFIIAIDSPDKPKLISGSAFNLNYTFGSEDSRFLQPSRTRGACVGVLSADGTAIVGQKCEWSYTVWGAKKGAGLIGDIY